MVVLSASSNNGGKMCELSSSESQFANPYSCGESRASKSVKPRLLKVKLLNEKNTLGIMETMMTSDQ
jgi:hypothetical protein